MALRWKYKGVGGEMAEEGRDEARRAMHWVDDMAI